MLDTMARRGPTAPKISCLLAAQSNISAAQSRTEVWLPKARYLGCAFNDEYRNTLKMLHVKQQEDTD
jgi:hypothetical protein